MKVIFADDLHIWHAVSDMAERPSNPDITSALALASELRIFAGKLKRKLREHGGLGDLTPSQIAVLSRLDREGPATTSALARAEGMRPQSMGTIIAALEEAGLVRGTPDPTDGRQIILDLTAACRDRIAASRAAREDWLLRTIQAELSAEERGQLAAGLALLERIIES